MPAVSLLNGKVLLLGGSPIRVRAEHSGLKSPDTLSIVSMGAYGGPHEPVSVTITRDGIDAAGTGQLLTFIIAGVAPVNVRVANATAGATVELPPGRIIPGQEIRLRITTLGADDARSRPRLSAPHTYTPPDSGFPYHFDFAFEE